MSKKSKDALIEKFGSDKLGNKQLGNEKPGAEMLLASYNAGVADGRLEAIEESIDAVAALIFKAEAMIAGLGENLEPTLRDNANHTLRALQLAFAAVAGAVNGSAACRDLLEQSRQRLLKKANAIH